MRKCAYVFQTLLFGCIFWISCNASAVYSSSDEQRLFKHLFKDYNRHIIPRDNSSVPIYISIKTFFLFLDNVDVKSQTYTARIFFELTWDDRLLTWQPDRYSGIEKINVPYDWIWTPDICIAGSVTDFIDIGKKGTTALVFSSGHIVFWPVKVFKITCVVDISQYPFDEQICEIDLSSWTYDDAFIKILAGYSSVNLSMLTSSGEWDIESSLAYNRTDPHNGLGYSHVIFPFRIRRRWQFIMLNTFFPTCFTSLLTVLCFCLPKESGEKVGLSISIYLTLAVFMTVTSQDLPETADAVSLLGAYVALQLGWSGTTIILTVISLVFSFQKNNRIIPRLLQILAKFRKKGETIYNRPEHEGDLPDSCRTPAEINNMNNQCLASEKELPEANVVVETEITWDYVASLFNTFCLACSVAWQLFVNSWFLYRSLQ